MTTLTQSNSSVMNTLLTGPDGHAIYEVSTPTHIFGSLITTVARHGSVVGTIDWHKFGGDQLTFEGRQGSMKELFPKSGTLSRSRTYTTRNGWSFKWKGGQDLYCVSVDSRINLATYERVRLFSALRSKKSCLYINNAGVEVMDALVVTWVIMEKYARDRRRQSASAGASAGAAAGGGGGGGGGC